MFGRVVTGMETVDLITQLPLGGGYGPFPQNAPLIPVIIRSATIVDRVRAAPLPHAGAADNARAALKRGRPEFLRAGAFLHYSFRVKKRYQTPPLRFWVYMQSADVRCEPPNDTERTRGDRCVKVS